MPGTLYVVATPIGNLGDLTPRAREVLASVALIAAEDTRHTRQLLQSCGIDTALTSLHEHNEAQKSAELVARLARGESIALVSDAGTPLVSDPGFDLVAAARRAGHRRRRDSRRVRRDCRAVGRGAADGSLRFRRLFACEKRGARRASRAARARRAHADLLRSAASARGSAARHGADVRRGAPRVDQPRAHEALRNDVQRHARAS